MLLMLLLAVNHVTEAACRPRLTPFHRQRRLCSEEEGSERRTGGNGSWEHEAMVGTKTPRTTTTSLRWTARRWQAPRSMSLGGRAVLNRRMRLDEEGCRSQTARRKKSRLLGYWAWEACCQALNQHCLCPKDCQEDRMEATSSPASCSGSWAFVRTFLKHVPTTVQTKKDGSRLQTSKKQAHTD